MKLNKRQCREMVNIIQIFIKDHGLSQFRLRELKILNGFSEVRGTITIEQLYKDFSIFIYEEVADSYEECIETLMHELTHLYLYDIFDYVELLRRHKADSIYITEANQMWEQITYKLSEYFLQQMKTANKIKQL